MRSTGYRRPAAVVAAIVVALGLAVALNATSASAATGRWVGGWSASPMGVGLNSPYPSGFSNKTVRNIVHMAAGGDTVRLRISNEWGSVPLRISSAEVARRTSGAAIDSGTRAKITFGGHTGYTIPTGSLVITDPIAIGVPRGSDLAVSLYTPDPTGRPTWHYSANSTSYLGTGDRVGQSDGAGYGSISSWYFVTEVMVNSTADVGTVVTFGDSITEGTQSTFNANHRYSDYLAAREAALGAGTRLSVVNAGIGSNRLLDDNYLSSRHEKSGLARFESDVLSEPNLRSVVMLMGTNDLSVSNPRKVTAADLITGYNVIIGKAKAKGATVVVATIPPGGTRLREDVRQEMNKWIRDTTRITTVVDFDALLRDPAHPSQIRAAYRGDEVHPNDAGYQAMAAAIPLSALD